jgi:hypothetical protein
VTDPQCRCSPTTVDGQLEHAHRCPAGGFTYVAAGRWTGHTHEEIDARLRPDVPEAPPE